MAQAKSADKAQTSILKAILETSLLPDTDEALSKSDMDEIASFITAAAQKRPQGQSVIRIEPQDVAKKSRAHSGDILVPKHHMHIAIINDDMPFLVDSIANCLARFDLVIHHLLHPVIAAERDNAGVLTALLPADTAGARKESFIFIEADRASANAITALEDELALTLAHVRAAVADWGAMQQALATDAEAQDDPEAAALLRWLLDRNMTQSGHALLNRTGKSESSLGICTLGDEPLLSRAAISAAFEWFEAGGRAPLILKSNRNSRIHRDSQVDMFLLPRRNGKKLSHVSAHAGLWTSVALGTPPEKVPVLRLMYSHLLEKHGFDPNGHAGKALHHALTTLPHDVVIGFDAATIERLALTFMSLSDRPRPKLVTALSALARHLYAFVWLPRDEVSTARRLSIIDMVSKATNAPLLGWSLALEDGGMAQLRLTFDMRDGGHTADEALLDRQLAHMVRGRAPAVEAALADFEEQSQASALAEKYANGFPINYRNGAGPEEAALDITELAALSGASERRARLYRNADDGPEMVRIKLYALSAIALSDAVPALENFGFRVIEEVTTAVGETGALGHIHRLILARADGGLGADLVARADMLCPAIADVLQAVREDDLFNELLVSAALIPEDANLLRALFRYLRQAGTPYGMSTFAAALRAHADITRQLIVLFRALHDPAVKNGKAAAKAAGDAITAALTKVSAVDEDRVLRSLRAVIEASLRTNFFTPAGKEALAVKLESAKVPNLPAPRPWREVWVYSPRVEGIHLRAGPVARGGLRWSDRRDDFRTEVLGLMKAQRVKNAVIVPTGAKGGFYPKQLPNPALGRDAWMAEGTESYRIFIRSLLSLTDNIMNGKVVHPVGMNILDEDDPYFVVAADKGTATFSDIANAIALEQGFWLGDAFASGGSNGYDHKAMGITARGAWISVQRHFAEMGVDVQSESVRVIGCGDMSGDVFGNGMLLSKAIKLVAAYDHRHIFFDPDPDPAKSWAERERLFKLPRSSWDDYDKALISKGGGVFARTMKSIPLSPQMRTLLGTDATEMDPPSLISTLLKAPADLLWFGGIGTYVKAASQSNSEVGDPTNDGLRVNGEDLRVRVVGEGANLGVTQAGRIAYALAGGRINTDFIDNSAGVDCSDNEVNIKIALGAQMAAGKLSLPARNTMLTAMTNAVSALVLADNSAQALGLSVAQANGPARLPSYVRLIETFEASGMLNRAVEGLAPNDQLLRRMQDRQGLTRPELAVLLSTAKLILQDAIEQSSMGADSSMTPYLMAAFPPLMQEEQAAAIAAHQLRDKVIATKLANRIINRLGLLHPFELEEEAGCALGDMASAFVVAERLFAVDKLWADVDAATMPEAARLALLGRIAEGMHAHMADILCTLPPGCTPAQGQKLLEKGVAHLMSQPDIIATPSRLARGNRIEGELVKLGAPEKLALRTVALLKGQGIIGLAHLSARMGKSSLEVGSAFASLGAALRLDEIQSGVKRLDPNDQWERLIVSGIASDLQRIRFDLLARLGGSPQKQVAKWLDQQADRITQYLALVERAHAEPVPTIAMFAELTAKARALLCK